MSRQRGRRSTNDFTMDELLPNGSTVTLVGRGEYNCNQDDTLNTEPWGTPEDLALEIGSFVFAVLYLLLEVMRGGWCRRSQTPRRPRGRRLGNFTRSVPPPLPSPPRNPVPSRAAVGRGGFLRRGAAAGAPAGDPQGLGPAPAAAQPHPWRRPCRRNCAWQPKRRAAEQQRCRWRGWQERQGREWKQRCVVGKAQEVWLAIHASEEQILIPHCRSRAPPPSLVAPIFHPPRSVRLARPVEVRRPLAARPVPG